MKMIELKSKMNQPYHWISFLFLLAIFSFPGEVVAGVEEGYTAYRNGDFVTALREFQPLAKDGHANVQTTLGKMYANGWGVQKDEKEAEKWFRLAAEQGRTDAQMELHKLVSNNQVTSQVRLAANQGNAATAMKVAEISSPYLLTMYSEIPETVAGLTLANGVNSKTALRFGTIVKMNASNEHMRTTISGKINESLSEIEQQELLNFLAAPIGRLFLEFMAAQATKQGKAISEASQRIEADDKIKIASFLRTSAGMKYMGLIRDSGTIFSDTVMSNACADAKKDFSSYEWTSIANMWCTPKK